MASVEIVAQAVWLMLPAYVANMSPVVLGGGTPVDLGRSWRGRRLLGDGKTWRGLAGGTLSGLGMAAVLHYVAPLSGNVLSDFGSGPAWIVIGLALAAGALLGDLVKSFAKRRLGIARGHRWFPMDQLDFVLGAWLLAWAVSEYAVQAGHATSNWFLGFFTPGVIVVVLILTPLLHLGTNALGHKLGTKEVPW